MKVQFVFAPPLVKPKFAPYWESALPPLGILYLAGHARASVHGLEFRATDGLQLGLASTVEDIVAYKPDVLCVSFYTGAALGAYELMRRVKVSLPDTWLIAGGPHATGVPEDVLENSPVDVVVRGEGEVTLAILLQMLQDGCRLTPTDLRFVQGVAYRGDDGVTARTIPRPNVRDIDSLAFPAWDLIPLSDYHGYHLVRQLPEYPILFSRGCPFDCVFCPNEHWNIGRPRLRHRTPQNIVDEMKELISRYGIREFHNLSDELNNDLKAAEATCEEIARQCPGVTWKTLLRSDRLPEHLVEVMARSGCWLASLGIETGNDETLTGVRKHFTLEQVENTCRLLKKYGIKVQGLFMLFNVWTTKDGQLCFEDVEASRRTVQYAERLAKEGLIHFAGWSVATPYPGSELYSIALQHNMIKPELLGHWDEWNVTAPIVMKLPGVPEVEMIRVLRSARLLGAKLSLANKAVRPADIWHMTKTAVSTARTEIASMFQPTC